MIQTRRFAAILAADVAGYRRQMGEDETETAQVMREQRRRRPADRRALIAAPPVL